MSIAYITHELCTRHDMGAAHPERPARLYAINDHLIATGLMMVLQQYDAPAASRNQLARVHEPAYVDSLFAASPATDLRWLDEDTAMNPFSFARIDEAGRQACRWTAAFDFGRRLSLTCAGPLGGCPHQGHDGRLASRRTVTSEGAQKVVVGY